MPAEALPPSGRFTTKAALQQADGEPLTMEAVRSTIESEQQALEKATRPTAPSEPTPTNPSPRKRSFLNKSGAGAADCIRSIPFEVFACFDGDWNFYSSLTLLIVVSSSGRVSRFTLP
jgi:hypothetical protein